MATTSSTLDGLYGSTAVAEYDPKRPYLAHAPWPQVMVRRARFEEWANRLDFTVLAARQDVENAVLVCGGIAYLVKNNDTVASRAMAGERMQPWGISVQRNGTVYSNWSVHFGKTGLELDISSPIKGGDTMFSVLFD